MSTPSLPPSQTPNGFKFLESGQAKTNLERLAAFDLFKASKTACATQEILHLVPRFGLMEERIRYWSNKAGQYAAIAEGGFHFLSSLAICSYSMSTQPSSGRTFYDASLVCLKERTNRLFTSKEIVSLLYLLARSKIITLGTYLILETFFKDSLATRRIELLDSEYSAIAQEFIEQGHSEKQNVNAQKKIRMTALRLLDNLPVIEKKVIESTQLQKEQIAPILKKLSIAANQVLRSTDQNLSQGKPLVCHQARVL